MKRKGYKLSPRYTAYSFTLNRGEIKGFYRMDTGSNEAEIEIQDKPWTSIPDGNLYNCIRVLIPIEKHDGVENILKRTFN